MKSISKIFVGLIFFICCLSSNYYVIGQQQIINLDQPTTGNQEYVALEQINMNPGFSYSATPTESLWAKIGGFFSGNIVYQNQPNINRTINTSYRVGTINGVAAVSNTGASNYTFPILIPPGTNGMQPELSVSYSSQTGLGFLGIGWSLSGFSAISRMGKTLYNSNKKKEVNFNNDLFALDGNRLNAISGGYGHDNTLYNTEIANFATITSYGTTITGMPDYFIVETKKGITMEYGVTSDSRIEAQGSNIVLMWLINKITDKNGNYITISYKEDNSTGEFIPDEIEYTGNSNENITPYNKIKFEFKKTASGNLSFIAGSGILQRALLDKLIVYAQGTVAHRYEFKYTLDFYPHLTEIIKYAGNGSRYNSTIIEWGSNASNMSVSNGHSGNNSSDLFFYFSDYNNDGKTDFIRTSEITTTNPAEYEFKVFLNQGNNSFTTVNNTNNNLGSDFLDHAIPGSSSFDYNGDGYIDWISKSTKYNPDCHEYKVHFGSGNGIFTENTIDYNSIITTLNTNTKVFCGNFDDDNKSEILLLEGTCAKIATSEKYDQHEDPTRYVYFNYPYPISNLTNFGEKQYLLDFNGDGKTDILIVDDYSTIIYEINRTGTDPKYTFSATVLYSSGSPNNSTSGFPSKWHRVFPGDFNGDGKADLLTYVSSHNWALYYSTGIGFSKGNAPALTPTDPEAADDDDNVFIGDFNGDGKSDVLQTSNSSGNKSSFDVFYSHGLDFTKETNSFLYDKIKNNQMFLGDFNGDGKSDFYHYRKTILVHQNKIISFHPEEKKHSVHKILNGLNHKTQFDYLNTTNSSVYTPSTTTPIGTMNYQIPLLVVSSFHQSNGNGGLNTNTYKYSGMKIRKKDRGFIHFESVEISSSKTKTVKTFESYNNKNIPHSFLKKVQIYTLTNTLVSSTTHKNGVYFYSNNTYFPHTSKTTNEDLVSGNTTITNYQFNKTNGNLINKTIDYNNSEALNIIKYTYNSNHLVTSLETTKTVSTTGATPSYYRRADMTYDANDNLLSTINDPGMQKSVTTDYTYDGFGNILSATLKSTSLSNRETLYEYDIKGRFMIKKTSSINPNPFEEEFTYEPVFGNVLTAKDINGNITASSYDVFGSEISKTLPTGFVSSVAVQWSTNGPQNTLYSIQKTNNQNSQITKEYFDKLGRLLRTESKGFKGNNIYQDLLYTDEGLVFKKSDPYYSTNTPVWITYSYDNLSRVYQSEKNSLVTHIQYSNTTIHTTLLSGQFNEITKNALGQTIEAKDNGGTITYIYHANGQLEKSTYDGLTTTIVYDDYGNRRQLQDPDVGDMTYDYNAFGELISQTDPNGNQFDFTYDVLGRVLTKAASNASSAIGTTTYTYDTKTNGKGLTATISSPDNTVDYSYDQYQRITQYVDDIQGTHYTTQYSYNTDGTIDHMTYPSGFEIEYVYNNYGYQKEINQVSGIFNNIWKAEDINEYGQLEQQKFGNNLVTNYSYDAYNYLSRIKINGVYDMEYQFNPLTGNLNYRKDDLNNNTETFTYDNLNRLTNSSVNNGAATPITLATTYTTNGNIKSKSDAGTFDYGTHNAPPHAISAIANYTSNIPTTRQDITYNHFNNVKCIDEGLLRLEFTYGVDDQRRIAELKNTLLPGSAVWTKYYSVNYEKEVKNGVTRERNYIFAGNNLVAVYYNDGTFNQLLYVTTDHLGSINLLTDVMGAKTAEYSFDAWGRRRNPTDWSYTGFTPSSIVSRGFTGHEHMDEFTLINMNGRVYDPVLGRMLSPDNYVQAPGLTQSFNRYSYTLNNPLSYTDPSGESWAPIIGWAIMTLAYNYAVNVKSNGMVWWPGDWTTFSFHTQINMAFGKMPEKEFATSKSDKRVAYTGNSAGVSEVVYDVEKLTFESLQAESMGLSFGNSSKPPWVYTSEWTKVGILISETNGRYDYSTAEWVEDRILSSLTAGTAGLTLWYLGGGLPDKVVGVIAGYTAAVGYSNLRAERRTVPFVVDQTVWYGSFDYNLFTGTIYSVNTTKIVKQQVYKVNFNMYQERIVWGRESKEIFFMSRGYDDGSNWKPTQFHFLPRSGRNVYD